MDKEDLLTKSVSSQAKKTQEHSQEITVKPKPDDIKTADKTNTVNESSGTRKTEPVIGKWLKGLWSMPSKQLQQLAKDSPNYLQDDTLFYAVEGAIVNLKKNLMAIGASGSRKKFSSTGGVKPNSNKEFNLYTTGWDWSEKEEQSLVTGEHPQPNPAGHPNTSAEGQAKQPAVKQQTSSQVREQGTESQTITDGYIQFITDVREVCYS